MDVFNMILMEKIWIFTPIVQEAAHLVFLSLGIKASHTTLWLCFEGKEKLRVDQSACTS
jgi:hypothetical protein